MSLPLYPKPLKYWGNSNLRLVVPCSYTLGWAYLNFNYERLIILQGWVHQSSGLWEEQIIQIPSQDCENTKAPNFSPWEISNGEILENRSEGPSKYILSNEKESVSQTYKVMSNDIRESKYLHS